MKNKNKLMGFFLLQVIMITAVFAEIPKEAQKTEATEESATVSELKLEAHALWKFNGFLKAENGSNYAYYFVLARKDDTLYVNTALFDADKRSLLMAYQSQAAYQPSEQFKLQIGHAYLYYNPVNTSWSLGMSSEDAKSFKIKIDMLGKTPIDLTSKLFPKGFEAQMQQSNRVNGHLRLTAEKELFVTSAHNSLFHANLMSPLQSVDIKQDLFCSLDNGESLYSADFLKKHQAENYAVLLSAEGEKSNKKSGTIKMKSIAPNEWKMTRAASVFSLKFDNLLNHNAWPDTLFYAGFLSAKPSGFCLIMAQPS